MNTNRKKRILSGGWLRLLNIVLVVALVLNLLPIPAVQATSLGAVGAPSPSGSRQLDPLAAENLVTNGDFSLGDTGWSYTGSVYFATGIVDFSGGDTPIDGVLWQQINTMAGRSYTLDYDVFRIGPGGGTPQVLVKVIDAGTSAVIASTASAGGAANVLVHYTLTFVAQGPVIVRFADQTTNTIGLDLGLDNVSVSPDLTEDHASVTVNEGQMITNTGTYTHKGPAPLALSASVGTLTQAQTATPIHFFRGNGNANDSAAGGVPGTINGAVTFATGQVDQAFSFPGSGGAPSATPNVEYPATDFAPGTGDFSVAFGLKTSASDDRQAVLGNRSDPSAGNFFEVKLLNGLLTMSTWQDAASTNYVYVASTTPVNDGLFHHIVVTRQGPALNLYIDGTLNVSGTTYLLTPVNILGAYPFRLGADQGQAAWYSSVFEGLLDEVRIYNQALSPADIARDYSAFVAGHPAPDSSLTVAGYWQLGEDDPGAANGLTGNNPTLGRDGSGLSPTLNLTRDGSPTYTSLDSLAAVIFNSFSGDQAFAGPTVDTVFTTTASLVITSILNWHQNTAFPGGQDPTTVNGTISILAYPSGTPVGTWPAAMLSGSPVGWEVFPNTTLPSGSYQIVESQTGPSSWSYTTSGGGPQWEANKGMSQVSAVPFTPNNGSVRAMAFNGSTDGYVSGSPVTAATDNFGIEAWVRFDSSSDQVILYNGNTSTSGFGLLVSGGTYLGVYGGNVGLDTGVAATPNIWHDVALVCNNGVSQIYVDGTMIYSNTVGGPNPATDAFAIGRAPQAAGDYLAGSVDDARVFTFTPGTFDPQDLLINTSVSGNWSWSYTPDDGPAQSQEVTVTATTGVSGETSSLPFSLIVNNVVPTATLGNGGAVNEGSSGTVSFSGQHDPSTADTTAGFHYAYDFNNDGTFEVGDGTYAGSVAAASATVPASYLAQGPGTRTVLGRILDKDGGYTNYTTTITINNVAPVAQAQSVTTSQNTPVTITLAATDAGNDPLTYSIVTPPAHGTLSGTGATRIYTPTAGYSGGDSFTFKANDGVADSNEATVSLTVNIVNHTVTFNSNGGTGTMTPQVANVPTALTANTFTRAGYTFTGWNTNAGGTGTAYADGALYAFSADVTLYAQWTALPNHTVTFNSNGGTGSMSNQSANVPTALTANTFTRTGYSFAGWNTNAGGTGTAYADGALYAFSADVTLYAQWTALPNHTVTFNSNGGTGTMTAQVANVPTALTANTFTRTGYTFAGWNTQANGLGTDYADGALYAFAADVTLYAQWTALPNHTVTFNSNGGAGTMTAQSANVPTALTANTFTRTGYVFAGWNTNAGGTGTAYADGALYAFAADITLYAQWTTLPLHTVTFDSNGGTGTMSNQVANVPMALTTNTFTRAGYTFAGWNTNAGGTGTAYADGALYAFAADITLYAQWTALPNHTVTFNSNGGTGTMTAQVANVPTALTTNTFTRTGYTFAGWNTNAGGTGTAYADGALYAFAADVTLYAQWTALPLHTATFNSNGGSGTMSPQAANVPTALNANLFTHVGYSFSGWNTNAGGTGTAYANGATYDFSADVTLYAQWTALPMHTVTFNNNGGAGTMTAQSANVPTALTTNTFTRTGYTFAGWNTTASGTGAAYADGETYFFGADITLYAQWTALPNHTVTFDANGGTGSMTAQVANVPTALTANAFTRTGYTFAGWNTNIGGTGTAYADGATYSFSADVTLYAQWTALPNHTVTFNSNGGTDTMTAQVANIPTALTANTFTRTGYTFSGWNTAANGSGTSYADGALYSFAADVTLYAQWTALPNHTVTFNSNGGTGTMTAQVANIPTALTANTFTRTGYTFSGWNTAANGSGTSYADGALYSFAADVTLYAQWTALPNHTVTFNSNGGTGTMTAQVANIPTALTANTFTRTGYSFSGWNTASNGSGTAYADGATYAFAADVTLYAQWTALPNHTVTFDSNGGTGTMSPQTANVPTALHANTFTRAGYTFAGWNTTAGGTGAAYADGETYFFGADITLYAQWTAFPNHTVTFNNNGGTGTMTAQVANVPTALNANTFTRTGYVFAGWNTAANGSGTNYADGAVYAFAADVTLYAQWTALPNHTVTFNSNGGTGTMAPQIANIPTALTANTFTRTGYVFAGWNTASNGTGTAYADGAVYSFSADVTLYAQWTALPNHTVTFNSNGGTGTMTAQVANVPTALTANTFTRTGYTFAGWNTASNGSGTAYADGAVYAFSADVTLYAQWTALPNHTVTFDSNGGTGTMTAQVANVPTALTLNTFTRVGYTFAGWNTQSGGGGTSYADGATYAFSADITLYAQWTALPNHTVTFNNNGGTGTMTAQVANVPTALNANTFTRTGYVFAGWNTNAGGTGTAYADGALYSFSADITLYAQWTALPNHTVTFNSNGGTGTMSNQVTNVPTALTTNTFTRTGYTFADWNTAANGSGTSYADGAIYSFAADVTLYAQWTALPNHTVTFNSNGGTGTMTAQVANVPTALTANTFTRTGYSFSGWNTAANGSGTAYADGATYNFSADVTLYAQWTALPNHTVTFNSNGGTGTMTAQVANIPTALNANTFTRTGYTFAGWNTNAGGTGTAYADGALYSFSADVTLYAQWTALPNHTVTFNSNGGSGTMTAQVANVPTALTANTFTRTGYFFSGWNTASNGSGTSYADGVLYSFAADVTLYAQWTALPLHTVTFDSNGGTGTMTPQVANVPTALTTNTFTRTGYTFAGWNTASNGSGTAYADGATYAFSADITLYAQWTALPNHTVTFDSNGGSGTMAPETHNIPTALTANTFTRTGYTFAGWNTTAGGTGTSYTDGALYAFSADITLYAQWTALPNHTVTFDSNGGSGTMTAQVANIPTALTANTFTRTGYTFVDWTTAANGTGTHYADGATYAFSADVTLYAQWTALPNHTVTFNSNGGSGTMSNQVANVPTALTTNTFTHAGYTFAGWNTNAGGTGTAYADGALYAFAADVTLYVQWTALPNQTVTFNSNGGTGTMSNQVANVPTALNANAFTRTGYSFSGWNTAANGSGTSYADGAIYAFAADVTLYAQWTALPNHTVTFNSNGGTGTMSNQVANVPTALNANAFTRTGYSFAGWNTASNGSGTNYADGALYAFGTDVTLYAQWTALPLHTVTFNSNGGSGTMTAQVANIPTALNANTFTRTGYVFAGWNTNAGGTGTAYADGAVYAFSADVTLYAQWTVLPNRAPVAVNDTYSTTKGTPLTVAAPGVLSNDTDADGDPLTAIKVSNSVHGGIVVLNANGGLVYAPPTPDFTGVDSFTYKVNDGMADSNIATVTIVVGNHAPVAVNDTYSAHENTPLTAATLVGVLTNDTDADGDLLTAIKVTDPAHGTVTLNANGSFVYTPAAGYHGTDSFTYKANDGATDSNVATVTFTINAAPVAVNDAYSVHQDTPRMVPAPGVLANDTDAEGDPLTAIKVSDPAHGVVTLNADGSFIYTPTAGYNGADSFTYKANDGATDSNVATVSLTVTAVNVAPVAVNDTYTTTQGTPLIIAAPGVLINDTDADGDPLTAIKVSNSVHGGIVVLNANGALVYAPPTPGFTGVDSFTYKVNDGTADSNVATVTIVVGDHAPVAVNDAYGAHENTPLTVTPAAGVLTNDTDADGDSLTAIKVSDPAHGTVTLNANGSFVYTPTANYHGTDNFTYKANDGAADSNVATVTFTINAAPVAVNDAYSVHQNTPRTVAAPGVLANDTDAEGDPLTAIKVSDPAHGTVSLNADGSFIYTPTAGYSGADSFTYKANDGATDSNVATVTITVTAANVAPVAMNDTYTTTKGTPLTVAAPGVLSNDTDADGDPLTAIKVSNSVHGGIVVLNANGGLVYAPPTPGFTGVDSFTYKVNDGTADSNVATVTIVVGNHAPVAVNDAYGAHENTPLTVTPAAGVLTNDTDADGDSLTAIKVSDPAHGVVTLNANGSFVYTPTANYHGTDSFTYRANDGADNSNTATVSLIVNAAPVAVNDAYSVHQDTPRTVAPAAGVLSNDTDAEGDPLTAIKVSDPAHGVVTFNANGSFIYTPTAGYSGGDSFTYKANDGATDSNVATVTLTVSAGNVAPVAVNDTYSTTKGTPLTVVAPGVLSNDTDADGDPLTAVKMSNSVHGGIVVLNSNGGFVYAPPAPDFTGVDSFTYKANDGMADSNVVTVTINVVNQAPVAVNETYTTTKGTPLTIVAPGVLTNDTDADGDPLTAIKVSNSAHGGIVVLSSNGALVYAPPTPDFTGVDSFTYKVNDGLADSNVATVTIVVGNHAPLAVNDAYSTNENTPLTVTLAIGVLTNDTDADGDPLTITKVSNPAHGALTLNADGSFVYTPTTNYHGADSFTYKANDGALDSNVATVNLTVIHVNHAPVAMNDAYTAHQDTPRTLATSAGVLSNDTDAEGDPLTAIKVSNPAHGAVALNADGSFTYTPTVGYSGADSFTYKANDGATDSNIATVSLTVTAVNVAPVAVNDTYGAHVGTPRTVAPSAGVLINDTDAEGDPLTAVKVTDPTHGTVMFNADGSFTYTPTVGYSGVDSFTYQANDGTTNSNVATVTITVVNANHAPVAVNDAYSTNEGTPLMVAPSAGVLSNDTDAEGDPLTAVKVSDSAHGGIVLLLPNGALIYAPPASDFTGVDSFTYKANDGTADSNIVTVTITVVPVNQAPLAVSDAYTTTQGTPLTVVPSAGVLSNDTDADGDPLTAIKVSNSAHGGIVVLNSNGGFVYAPPTPDFTGVDSFTYKANDGIADSNVATVTITVAHVNHAPVAVNDTFGSTNEDTPLIVAPAAGVLSNDTDADGDPLTAIKASDPAHGVVTLNADGSFVYTPTANYHGSDSFTYRANDGVANSNLATVSLTVNAVNDAPVAVNDAYSTHKNTPRTVAPATGVLTNDTDADGDPLTAIKVSNPAHGALTLNANGSFIYTPTAGYSGADSFTYRANDGTTDSNVATVRLTVNAANAAPVAVNDAYTAHENKPLTVATATGVLANDTDAEGDPLTAVKVSDPAHGALTLNANGSFIYTPTAGYSGADSFTYRANDGTTDSNVATVSFTVNAAPVAVNDTYNVHQDTPRTVAPAAGVLANDTDAEGDPLTAIKVSDPTHGTVTLNADGSFTYTPATGYAGGDSFTYRANDGAAGAGTDSNVATVTLTVNAVDIAPVAVNDTYSVHQDTPRTVSPAASVLSNDTDAEGDPLTAIKVSDPAHGTVTLNADGSFTYIPTAGYSGADSFTYRANDGAADSNVATVSLTVNAVNVAPVAVNDAFSTNENTPLTVVPAAGVLINDTDAEGDPLTAVLVSGSAHGALTLNADGSFVYTPAANYFGSDSFTYRANDGAANSNTATVNLTVNAVGHEPKKVIYLPLIVSFRAVNNAPTP